MDAIKLWVELFPKHKAQIEDVWTQIESAWTTIRAFRDKAGFHADKPMAFFKARNDVLLERQGIDAAIEKFQNLLRILLRAEAEEIPDLYQAVDDFLDELKKKNQLKYTRADFKRYLMLRPPVADTTTVSSLECSIRSAVLEILDEIRRHRGVKDSTFSRPNLFGHPDLH